MLLNRESRGKDFCVLLGEGGYQPPQVGHKANIGNKYFLKFSITSRKHCCGTPFRPVKVEGLGYRIHVAPAVLSSNLFP